MAQKPVKTHKHPVNIEFSRLSSAAEQQFCKLWVVGSIPTVGSIFFCGFPQENGDFPETVSSSATGIATRDESGSLAATLLQSPLTQG